MEAKTDNNLSSKPARRSGIELLKIFAMFAIVICHVTQTLGTPSAYFDDQSYVLDFAQPTTQWQYLILVILRHGGVFGNMVFFVCTAWYLQDSKRCDMKKWMFLLVEVWYVSIIVLLAVLIHRRGEVNGILVISSLLPTLHANSWYLTCYLLFYPIHPYLNIVIRAMGQRTLLRSSAALTAIYFGAVFLKPNLFLGAHPLILWLTIYLLVAYLKTYCASAMNDFGRNLSIFIIALLCFLASILCLNNLAPIIMPVKEQQLLRFCSNSNPMILIMAISLFNIARVMKLQSRTINTVASLSMLIYLLHENVFMSAYYRPEFIRSICQNYGYDHILLIVLAASTGIYLFFAACAWLIQRALHSPMRRISDRLYTGLRQIFGRIEDRMIESR